MTEPLFKAILQGDPGTGKTGSLASLADAGFRVILCDFDGNPEALQFHTKNPERVIVVPFGDELEASDTEVKRKNKISSCRAFTRFLFTGNEATGKPSTWGRETILVLDSLSAFADNAERLALELNKGVTRDGAHIGVLGNEIETAINMLMGKHLQCHRAVIAHLKLIAPKPESSYQGETDLQKQVKREIASLQETAFFPNMPGIQVSRTLARMFNTALLYELTDKNRLVIRTQPLKGYTIKVPAIVPDNLPIETGLLTILQAFGESGPRADPP